MKCSLLGAIFLVLSPVVLAQDMTPQDSAANIAQQIAKVRAETALTNARVPFHANWDSLAAYRTPEWFQDAKFGIFLHWGVYSVPAFGNEWYSRNMYVPGNAAFEHHVATYGPQSKFGYKDFIPHVQGGAASTPTRGSISSRGPARASGSGGGALRRLRHV